MEPVARLVSVNVGRPAPLAIGARVVRSAIVKRPVSGAVAVAVNGVAGDEQANRRHHGGPYKAVYAYAREDVAWWERELGRPLDDGAFGESLTLSGVDVSGARVGERWRVGTVELEVSGPRTPCAKLGARMGDPRFPRRFVAAGRPGAYLAVATPGVLRAGDAVELLHRPGHDVTSALVMRIALREPARLDELEPARADMNPELLSWLERAA
ncbi:MAG TPA: MOSC domain-containing protein [Solirubrobacteraceae bacterium]